MLNVSAGQVESSTGGILVRGTRDAAIPGVSIDTRTLRPGDLFFAIRGPKHDGHEYLDTALRAGAIGVVVDARHPLPTEFPSHQLLLQVEDTHQALKDLATDVRRQWRGSLVGITGSMGKTTSKEFTAQVLQTEYSVYRSPGNLNNLFGLPLAIFGLDAEDHIGIFELGMSAPGEIAEMCRIAKPDVGVITNVAPVHLEFFASLADIARAKAELASGLPPDGVLVYNEDDPLVREIAAGYTGHRISFGLSESSNFQASDIEITGLQETRFKIRGNSVTSRAVIPLGGEHFVRNALPAVALGAHYRIPMEQIVESLRHLHSAHMRGQIVHFREGFTVIDDSYNSNPRALMQMTETLCRIPSYTRRILVAGEMLELGKESGSLHYGCGTWAAECGVDLVVAVQGAAKEIVRGAVDAGVQEGHARFFTDVDSAAEYLSAKVQVGDLVLIKGSRGVRLERLMQLIRTRHPEQAA